MADKTQNNSRINGRLAFFQEFLKHPFQIGSVVPSSRFLEQRVLEVADISTAQSVVELGSGTGGITRAILAGMPQDARLLSIEINPCFYSLISQIKDKRFIAHLGNASLLAEVIAMYGVDAPDVIISGIPFSTMDHHAGSKLLESVSSVLAPHGRFVAYQVSKRVTNLCQPIMGEEYMEMEFLNIPPMRVYQWEKHEA